MLETLLVAIKHITMKDLENGETVEDLMLSTSEELGELSAAISVEKGRKQKELDEDSKSESLDLAICAFAVYFAQGGKIDDIPKIVMSKLAKWNAKNSI